ncbi:MAG: NAD(P)H-hydrate epimerase [Nanoarchaeota archaeon]|nr:NAD(P)H-hydrate epimerase [Nanoarchaeota archaeon]MBU1632232.1 NAD(P)H-hydrate epimerase [Nanoarchaeota archaeon]MBU1876512.1 NAD(P)H-hydrate epimerase [Nanoarchaeota archaeon]
MITSLEMQELEKKAVQEGISVEILMENAGRKVFEVVKRKYDIEDKHIVIFAGPGNNGGDGFVAARYFAEECPVIVIFFGDENRLSEEARLNYNKIKDYINVIKIANKEDLELFHFQKDLSFILIDSLLGTGVKSTIRELISSGIDLFNSLSGTKVAVDLPSGLDPDTGEIHDKSCEVDLIVCFHDLKVGLEKFKKKTIVVDIGIPR